MKKIFLLIIFLLTYCANASPQQLRWHEARPCTEINTPADEFAPVREPGSEKIIFCSSESGLSKFYSSAFSGESFSPKEIFPLSKNQERNNYSYLSFSPDRTVYFSSFRKGLKNSFLNIFKTSQSENFDGEILLVENINENTFTAHPTISPNGSTLIFSSDRAGGQGGTDLWLARKENSRWSAPENLSDILNSEGNEITPFFASDDTLYFSSDGHGGKGGYEIFLSVQIGGIWQMPVPLTNLNSEADESDFATVGSEYALYSSNKPGGKGGLDLYLAAKGDFAEEKFFSQTELTFKSSVSFITVTEDQTPVSPIQLIPEIFFAKNSSQFPYELRLLDRNAAKNFSLSAIEPTIDSAYSNLLNVIGFRMRNRPNSVLKIRVYSEYDESSQIAMRRYDAVRAYLGEVWEIENSRIIVDYNDGLRPEKNSSGKNRRAEFSCEDGEIFSPLIFSKQKLKLQPEKISFTFDGRPRHSIKNWEFFFQNEARIVKLSEGEADKLPHELQLNSASLSEEISHRDSIKFILSAALNSGEKIQATLIISIQKIILQSTSDAKRENFILLVFDTNTVAIGEKYGGLFNRLKNDLLGGSTVSVRYFSAARNTDIVSYADFIAEKIRANSPDKENSVSLRESDTPLSILHSLVQRFPDAAILITVEKNPQ